VIFILNQFQSMESTFIKVLVNMSTSAEASVDEKGKHSLQIVLGHEAPGTQSYT
jgi:hypothetical protein